MLRCEIYVTNYRVEVQNFSSWKNSAKKERKKLLLQDLPAKIFKTLMLHAHFLGFFRSYSCTSGGGGTAAKRPPARLGLYKWQIKKRFQTLVTAMKMKRILSLINKNSAQLWIDKNFHVLKKYQ